MDLAPFFFAHDEMFLVPPEHISESGISDVYAKELTERRGTREAWLELFASALGQYLKRQRVLAERAPKHWLPPRLLSAFFITTPEGTRPYYQPFAAASWLLYEGDFDPDRSSLELATYQLVLAERLGVSGELRSALLATLSYFPTLDDEQAANFGEGCRRTERPDGDAFRALADALPWLRQLRHASLYPPRADEPMSEIPGTGLFVPNERVVELEALVSRVHDVASVVVSRYFEHQHAETAAEGRPVDRFTAWLRKARPTVLLSDRDGEVLWDPEEPDRTDRVQARLADIPARPAEGLRADLDVVSQRSRAFLDALKRPDALRPVGEALEQEGGTYIHESRLLMVYSLGQPGLDPTSEAAPPYHRLLLGSRTMHEWGHLAVDAGLVPIASDKAEEHQAAHTALKELFDRIVADAPSPFAGLAQREVKALADEGCTLGDMPLRRMEDYQVNVLSRRLLPAEEIEAYVRNNVRSLVKERSGPYLKLARYAYEFQYLRLAAIDDPLDYFFKVTWYEPHFIGRGLMTRDRTVELFDAVRRLCDCYAIDETAFPVAGE